MDQEDFYIEEDNRGNQQQILEESYFHHTVMAFEELLATYDSDLVVWSLNQDSIDKLNKAITAMENMEEIKTIKVKNPSIPDEAQYYINTRMLKGCKRVEKE